MKYKMFKLRVSPAIEATDTTMYKEFTFSTKNELIAAKESMADLLLFAAISSFLVENVLIAAKESMADLLLFMQDEVKCMPDFSNWFVIEVLPCTENSIFEEIEEEDLIYWNN